MMNCYIVLKDSLEENFEVSVIRDVFCGIDKDGHIDVEHANLSVKTSRRFEIFGATQNGIENTIESIIDGVREMSYRLPHDYIIMITESTDTYLTIGAVHCDDIDEYAGDIYVDSRPRIDLRIHERHLDRLRNDLEKLAKGDEPYFAEED